MTRENIINSAWTDFFMEFVTMSKLRGQNVMIFKSGEKSDINGFVLRFQARKVYDRHNEDELYGVII